MTTHAIILKYEECMLTIRIGNPAGLIPYIAIEFLLLYPWARYLIPLAPVDLAEIMYKLIFRV